MLKNAKKILIFIAGTIRILVAKGSVNLLCTNVTSVRYKMLGQYLASTLILMRSTVQVMVRKMPLIGIAGLQVNHEIVVAPLVVLQRVRKVQVQRVACGF